MKVLITGGTGQVGRTLATTVPAGIEAVVFDRKDLDIRDTAAVRRQLEILQPQAVINAAAYTAVDKAESERDEAFAVNAQAAAQLARACRDFNATLIHLSTDFVFDGSCKKPYQPYDPAAPLNVYGASKLAGEREVAAVTGLHYLIFRTAWVYASQGNNFLRTMLRLFRERRQVGVVADQIGTPTSARSLASCLWHAAQASGRSSAILHFTDAGVASWYDFAVAIYEEARLLRLLGQPVDIVPITTAQYPTAARRPSYSVLDKSDTWARFGLTPSHWRVALREILQEIES